MSPIGLYWQNVFLFSRLPISRPLFSLLQQIISMPIHADANKNSDLLSFCERVIEMVKTTGSEKTCEDIKEAGVMFYGDPKPVQKGLVRFVCEKCEVCTHEMPSQAFM